MANVRWENIHGIKVKISNDTFTYIKHVIEIIHESLREIYFYRIIHSGINSKSDTLPLAAIISINNALMGGGVLGWAKLFGSRKEDTYFMRMMSDNDINVDFKCYFKKINVLKDEDLLTSLLKDLNMTADEFNDYIENMKKFRDNFIAHTDLSLHRVPKDSLEQEKQKAGRLKKYPNLESAEQSLLWFYRLIRDILKDSESVSGEYVFKFPTVDVLKKLTIEESEELNKFISQL